METPPCRVLYLNHAARPSGAEFALWRMLAARDPERVRPLVLFGEEGPAADLMREINVETHVLPLTGKVREVRKDTLRAGAFLHLGRLAAMVAYAVRVARFARQHRVEVIHTNTIKAHVYGALAGRLAGLPVVWHLRDYVNESYFPQAAVRMIRRLARSWPQHVVAVSRSVLEQLQLGDGGRKSTVVLDGLTDRELDTPTNPHRRSAEQTLKRIGIIGRLARWKGQHVFLDAAARVLAAGYGAEFHVVGAPLFGEGDYEAALHRQAAELGIAEYVHFHGFTRDVTGELSRLDLLVHASVTGEPFGQVILEGMAAGVPVIASRGGGVPEIVTHGENGLLTEMGDAAGLAGAVGALLDDPVNAHRLACNGHRHVREKFRASDGASAVADIYRQILTSGEARTPRPAPVATGRTERAPSL